MPPEPAPGDLKDFVFKDRKHDRINDALGSSSFGGGGNSTTRWREPCYYPRASPRRLPQNYHRQSVSYYQLYDEPDGHGCTPPRSVDGFRQSNGRYRGAQSSSRESRGSFRRSPYYDGHHATSQRSVAVPISSSPPPSLRKDLHDKNGGGDDQRSDRDQDQVRDRERDRDRGRDHSLGSIGWKSLKWSRQGPLLSKKAVRSEVEEAVNGSSEVSVPSLGKETLARSPVTSPLPSDDGVPKKKPRLTWGQGLAKYEKQKVEGSSGNSGKAQTSETSMKVLAVAGSTSPTTPCSAVRSSSPGREEGPFSRTVSVRINIDNQTNNHSETLPIGCQNCSEELPITDNSLSTSALTSLLNDLFAPEDACSGDSTSNRSTDADKLVSFKAGISKELERTECEIDLLETELRSLNNDADSVAYQNFVTLYNSPSSRCIEAADVLNKVSSTSTPLTCATTTAVCPYVEPALHVVCSSSEMATSEGKALSSVVLDKVKLDVREMAVTANVSGCACDLNAESSNHNTNLNINPYAKANNEFVDLVMAANRDAAKRASQVFDGFLPTASQQLDLWGSERMSLCRRNDMLVKEKIASQRCQLKFKEQVLALKFRALHHLWKEDLRLLSVKKQRPKSHKRLELSSRSLQSSSQKHRPSIRSRSTLPGNKTLLPTADIVEFTSKLLSNSPIEVFRNNLKMPALILNEKERKYSRFISNNNLVEDPVSVEKERSMINPWTKEETGVFMEMLATFGKDFVKISSFLSHKTTADCIEFYYKNHKSESFKDVKKQLDLRKQRQSLPSNTYLVPTSGKMWNHEANAASLEAAHNNTISHQKGKSALHSSKMSRGCRISLERETNVEVSVHERETTAAEMLAGRSGALSSEAVSSCITSSISPSEKMSYVRPDRPLTPDVTQTIEEDAFSDEGSAVLDSVDWMDDEKSMFVRALSMYGKDFTRISHYVRTKSRDQCKIFFSKARKCLSLDQVHSGAADGGTPVSDANGGRSDMDDTVAMEMDSVICSMQSCSKMDVEFNQSQPAVNASCEPSLRVEPIGVQVEIERSGEQHEVGVSDKVEAEGVVGGDEFVMEVEAGNLGSDEDRKEMLDVLSEKNEDKPSRVGAELSADGELGTVELTCTEGDELKRRDSVDVKRGAVSERDSAELEVKNDVALHPVLASDADPLERQQKENKATDRVNHLEFSFTAERKTSGNVSCSAPNAPVCNNHPSFNFTTGHQHRMPQEFPFSLQKKPQSSSSLLDNAYPVPLTTLLPDPLSFSLDGSHRAPAFNFQDHLRKLHQRSTSVESYQQYLSRIGFGQVHPSASHVLSGYPVQVLNQKESRQDANMISGKQMMHEYFMPDTSSTQPRPAPQWNEDVSDSQLRPCSTSCHESSEASTQRTGDVKLFGQILTKASSSSQENGSRPPFPKLKRPAHPEPPASKKCSSSSVFPSRPECVINQSALEEVPLQSYGFWDGTRIQTGFSSLPPSLFLAKDGGVVSSASNGITASFPQAYVPPLSTKGKRVDNFSGFQQGGGRAAVARLSGANGSGILVRPSGLTDPVAALKMMKLYNSEMESWTRDLNGR